MKQAFSILVPFLIVLGGCLSAPLPQELVDVAPQEPLLMKEVVQLSKIGISDEVIVGLIRTRGIADRPDLRGIVALRREGVGEPVILMLLASPAVHPSPKPTPRIVYRELFIPLWPSYARGRWHLGLRIVCYDRAAEPGIPEIVPIEPKPTEAPPTSIDP